MDDVQTMIKLTFSKEGEDRKLLVASTRPGLYMKKKLLLKTTNSAACKVEIVCFNLLLHVSFY